MILPTSPDPPSPRINIPYDSMYSGSRVHVANFNDQLQNREQVLPRELERVQHGNNRTVSAINAPERVPHMLVECGAGSKLAPRQLEVGEERASGGGQRKMKACAAESSLGNK